MVWLPNIVFMSLSKSKIGCDPKSHTELGSRPTHPWAIASRASSWRSHNGGPDQLSSALRPAGMPGKSLQRRQPIMQKKSRPRCRWRPATLSYTNRFDQHEFCDDWIYWSWLLINIISILYQYVMKFLSCKSDFPCAKTIRSSSVSQRVARATIVFCNLAQLRFCSHSSAPHTVETQIGWSGHLFSMNGYSWESQVGAK